MCSELPPLEIGPPGRAECVAALEMAWVHLARGERSEQIGRLIEEARAKPDSLAGLLVARRAGQVVGGVWAQLQAGGSAFLSLPHVGPNEPPETAPALIQRLFELLESRHIRLVQALTETDHGEPFDLLRAAGFQHFADLLYMVSQEGAFPDHPPAGELDFEPYAEDQQQRLEKLVECTYEGSQDCPELNGVREMTDVIAGYRGTGTFDPARWLFVRHAGADVGCLLLAEHVPRQQWELVYLGLVPAARGRGWGIAAVRQAQWLARRAHVGRLLLAVDAANEPAIGTYAAAGFAAWDRRCVMLRILGSPPDQKTT